MMDTSKEYIKMCEEAKEIQKLWGELTGDFCYCKDTKYRIVNIVNNPPPRIEITSHLWLPRQDQLQEMVGATYPASNVLAEFLELGFVYSGVFVAKDPISSCDSLEKAWLVFVMQKKYNKEWDYDSEEWVKL